VVQWREFPARNDRACGSWSVVREVENWVGLAGGVRRAFRWCSANGRPRSHRLGLRWIV